MAPGSIERRIFNLFADILAYPGPGLLAAVRECEALAAALDPALPATLRPFRDFVAETSLTRLEEVYTGTFDLDATCYPYVGYHLFGESYKRSLFLLKLKEAYRAFDISLGSELPDHIAPVLRSLAVCDDSEVSQELLNVALLPALDRMTGRAKSAGYDDEEEPSQPPEGDEPRSPYRQALEALRLVLQALPSNDTSSDLVGAATGAERPAASEHVRR